MDELIKILVLVLFLVVPALKAIFDARAEKKKQQEAKELGRIIAEQGVRPPQVEEEIALAEPLEQPERKRKPKIRSKQQQQIDRAHEAYAAQMVVQDQISASPHEASSAPDQGTVAPVTPGASVSRPESSPLVNELLAMFRSPTSMQQVVLMSEILKRPEEQRFFER